MPKISQIRATNEGIVMAETAGAPLTTSSVATSAIALPSADPTTPPASPAGRALVDIGDGELRLSTGSNWAPARTGRGWIGYYTNLAPMAGPSGETTVTWTTERTAGNDVTYGSGIFTVQRAGVWAIFSSGSWWGSPSNLPDTTRWDLRLYIDTVIVDVCETWCIGTNEYNAGTAGEHIEWAVSAVRRLNAGTTVKVTASFVVGTSRDIGMLGNFTMVRLGA